MLIEFYGTKCHFCMEMAPLVERLKKEFGVDIKQVEVWHDAENARLMEQYDRGICGGVPFFINTETNQAMCGAISYEKLKQWARGKNYGR